MIKTLQEVAKETLSRYKGNDGECLFTNPAWLEITDCKTKKSIDFEWFIDHLADDYNKMLKEHDEWLREG